MQKLLRVQDDNGVESEHSLGQNSERIDFDLEHLALNDRMIG
jgi:hypothetical protein